MSQISLPFDWTGEGGVAEFLVSDANALAVRHLEGWRDWPIHAGIVSGPRRSGKSILGRHFARLSGGSVIDDAETAGDEPLFHAWNRAQLEHRPLLLVSEHPPSQWNVALPDLRSRLAAAPHVRIAEPDEGLVLALVERGLMRAGAAWAADLPLWLHSRVERSYSAVAAVLECLTTASVSSGRKISVPFARETLQGAGLLPIVRQGREPDA